jgi:hypothetical protein
MTTPRQAAPRSKSRNVASQPAAQQSSAQSMAAPERQTDEADRQRNALDNQGSQGRHAALSLREEEDDETATRH